MYYYLKEFYPKFSCRKLRYEDDGAIAIAANKDLEMVYFNTVGCRFIQLADGTRSLDDITKIMLDEYEVETPVLEDDLVCLIRDMQWKRVVSLHKQPVEG